MTRDQLLRRFEASLVKQGGLQLPGTGNKRWRFGDNSTVCYQPTGLVYEVLGIGQEGTRAYQALLIVICTVQKVSIDKGVLYFMPLTRHDRNVQRMAIPVRLLGELATLRRQIGLRRTQLTIDPADFQSLLELGLIRRITGSRQVKPGVTRLGAEAVRAFRAAQ